ncbi:uncharacterized protein LOC134289447 [Aedes albopictus]|uniref:Endonuclease n=1 Tax=Aedes albopictus TaxID=7160 RepID=A0ABM1Z579_AEDAL
MSKPVTRSADSLKSLTTKLKGLKLSLSNICVFVKNFKDDTTAAQINVRLEKLDTLWVQISETVWEIEAHEDFEEQESLQTSQVEMENRYYDAKSFLVEKAQAFQSDANQHQTLHPGDATLHGMMDHVRLPQIKLQCFDGNIDDWLSFRDLYTSLIHEKPDLPAVEKFHYLKGCLAGEARALIDPLKITRDNYQVAWQTLLKRYNNNKLLKKKQVQALIKLPSLCKESITDLHKLVDGFDRVIQTLDQIIQPADYKDLLLVELLSSRLDPTTRRGWEEHSSTKQQDTVKDLLEFLQRRIQILEALPAKVETKVDQSLLPKRKPFSAKVSNNAVQSNNAKCPSCSEIHGLHICPAFLKMSLSSRESLLRAQSLCRNCLKRGHLARECASKFSCRYCKARHHSLLCFKAGDANGSQGSSGKLNLGDSAKQDGTGANSKAANASAVESTSSNAAQCVSSQVLLATAVVVIEDDQGSRYPARALLDSGSECNFITENLYQTMKVAVKRTDISIMGIGQSSTKASRKIKAVVKSRNSSYARSMEFLVLPKVTACLPTSTVQANGWDIPVDIELADPEFFRSRKVDLVLGIQAFFSFFPTGREIQLGKGLPVLTESVFGWIVTGEVTTASQGTKYTCNMAVSDDLEELMARFWSCEEVGAVSKFSPEEAHCEENYERTVKRESDGRYTVTLPKNPEVLAEIGESKDIALRRLRAVERRLSKDERLRKQYSDFMTEYLELGHMQMANDCEENRVKRCFLPHHPVIKESSTTTKVRVVFDASCKTSTGVSLNDALYAGPVVQQDLRSIVLRSRIRQVMVVADVEKMFRQIWTNSEDTHLQCVLWTSPDGKVSTYELLTVAYGTKSAPYLATRTLKQLASDERDRFPLAAPTIEEDVYMDDVISGADDVESAIELRRQVDAMMISGGFKLRKWASNRPEVLQGIPRENLALPDSDGIDWDQDAEVKALGLTWLPNVDQFRFKFEISPITEHQILTKRQVLCFIARLFDPLGLLGATITSAKIFMQRLWCLKNEEGQNLQWDDPLPEMVGEEWRTFHEQLPSLNEIRIPRCVIGPGSLSVEYHCFSDASTVAYGATIYVRSQRDDGAVSVHLLTSKSKVAPLKVQSLPRLELCGALLAAQLWEKVADSLKTDGRVQFWTDSTCVLHWIRSPPGTWTTFVANRVAKIQGLTEADQWRHVPGVTNPADLISRGISPNNILGNDMWWHGPTWLLQNPESWPKTVKNTPEEELEKRRNVVACTSSKESGFISDFLAKFSSFTRLIRMTAYWLRFLNNLRCSADEKRTGYLTSRELQAAEQTILQKVQEESFPDEISKLLAGTPVARNSPLRWYNPQMDENGILRVGGRLAHSEESPRTKHPIVLPARHALTELILQHHHQMYLHAGPQLLLGTVRQRYWPLGGRNLARKVVHQCQRCFRAKPSAMQQQMGELPAARVTVSRPFSKAGVDFFGPVYLRAGRVRTPTKAYVAIFVCMATKAVHMELVSDLSTERFLQALRRFFARRGRCTDIYSDNGTNFVGARNQIRELFDLLKEKTHRETVAKECANEGIYWHFNPPSAPHFGGLWEAAVRSAKFHLLRVVGSNPVHQEDFVTLLTQVEACMNSRPMTSLSDDPLDLEPLTPAHFLVGGSLLSMPDPDLSDVQLNRLTRFQLVQRQLQDFWRRWRREYLSQLQARSKHWQPAVDVQVGRLVVVVESNQPPTQWKMGRIQELHPGEDGVTRVVTVRTSTGSLKRPLVKLCLLPMQDQDK